MLITTPLSTPGSTFAADVHLGKLARLLRMFGFDTAYDSAHSLPVLFTIAHEQKRILLSRNPAIARAPFIEGALITSVDPLEQFRSLIATSLLVDDSKYFTRCLLCNGLLATVPKESVIEYLKPKTAQFYDQFWQCTACQKVYWKGPHYLRMTGMIRSMNTSS